MNHIYRSVWNEALGAWVAVSEISKGQGKRAANRRKLLATSLLICATPTWALPTGDQLVAGQATVSTPTANVLQIDQVSQKAVINWQGFSVAPTEAVNINQPDANAALLNRVVGQDASQIQGQINANGQVYLVNPNGVVFSKTAQVDVGGLIATTHDISNADFMNGNQHFTQNSATGTVENHGTINTKDGGVVALIGEQVTNTGTINTPKGTTALAAGKTVDLDFQGNGLVEVKVTEAALNAQITNQGAIQADGGRVVMTAKAANQLIDTVINQEGVIKARGLVERNGEIILDGGDNGITQVSGTLNVSGNGVGEKGGKLVVTGDKVLIDSTAKLNAAGATGGGDILVGGSWQNSDTRVRQATATVVKQGAVLDASATDNGKGGTVVAWSNIHDPNSATRAWGTFLAKGGVNGGDGGRIETSGHWLDVEGIKVDTVAPLGKSGTWLLDPWDVTIVPTTAPIGIGGSFLNNTWIPNATGSQINPATIEAALNSGNAVTITTTGTGLEAGNITVNAAITKQGIGDASLTLQAANSIYINFNIASLAGRLNLAFQADSDGSNGGAIQSSFATINSNGGNVSFLGGVNGAGYAQGNGSNLNGLWLNSVTLNSGGGNIVMRGRSSDLASSIGGVQHNDGVYISGNSVINSGTGTINIEGIAQGQNTGMLSNGIEIGNFDTINITSANTTADAIRLTGTAAVNAAAVSQGYGILMQNILSEFQAETTIAATGGGNITLIGSSNRDAGIHIDPHVNILANSGRIVLQGTTTGSTHSAVESTGILGQQAGSLVPTSSSNVEILADSLNLDTSSLAGTPLASDRLSSTGSLLIRPITGNRPMTVQLGAGDNSQLYVDLSLFGAGLPISPTFAKLVFGSPTTGIMNVSGLNFVNSYDVDLLTGGTLTFGGTTTVQGINSVLSIDVTGGGVTSSSALNVSNLLLRGTNSLFNFNNPANTIGTVAGVLGSGSLNLVNSQTLTIGSINGINGIDPTGTGTVTIEALGATSDLILNQPVVTADGNIILAAGRDFINNVLPINSGISITGTGQYFVYSSNPANSLEGMLNFNKHYNQTYTSGIIPSYATTGNWFLYTVAPQLLVAPDLKTITYSTAIGAYIPSYTGFIDGDTATTAGITGAALFDTLGATSTSGNFIVGLHDAVYNSGLLSSLGYSFADDGRSLNELTITPLPLLITGISANNKIYDSTTVATLSGTAFVTPITFDIVNLSGTATGSFVSPNVGNNSVTLINNYSISGIDASNYLLQLPILTANITPATLIYTANPSTRVYGAANPAFSGTVTGFVNTETLASATTGTANFTSLATSLSNVGNYAIDGSGLTANNGNYLFTQAASNATALSITPATLDITANSISKIYGETVNFTGTEFIASGLQNGETIGAVALSSLGANQFANVQSVGMTHGGFCCTYSYLPYFINANNASGGTFNASNYNINYNIGLLDVYPALLTYTANTATRIYGAENPTFSGTVTGFVNTDTLASATTGIASFTSLATSLSNVGNYAIDGSGLIANNGNYIFTQAATNATALSITPAALSITANNDSRVFNGLAYIGGNGVIFSGFVNGETSAVLSGILNYTGNSQGAINVGTYDITPAGLSAINYRISYVNGNLNILPEVLPPVVVPPVQNTPVVVSPEVVTPVQNTPPPINQAEQENIAGLITSVSNKPLISFEAIPVSSDLFVNDITDDFANNTTTTDKPATVQSNLPCIDSESESKTKLPNCQKREKNKAATRAIIPILKIKNSSGRVKHLEMSANKNFVSLLFEDGSVRVWDFQSGIQRQIVASNNKQNLTDIGTVNDKGDSLPIASKTGIDVHDIISSLADDKLAINQPDVTHFVTSDDGSLLLVDFGANALSLWDNKQNKKRWQLPYQRGTVHNLALATNKRYGAVLSRQAGTYVMPADLQLKSVTDAIDIVDLDTGKIIKSLPNMGEQIVYMQFKDNDTLSVGLASGELLDWAIANNTQETSVNFAESLVAVDKAKDTYAYLLKDGTVRVGDGLGHIRLSLQNKDNAFQNAKLLEDGKKLLTVLANGELALWDVASGKKMLRLFSTHQGWTVMDGFGRFDGSEEAMANFSWLANEEEIPLDNFSENYYEPGLLSNVLQNQDYLNSDSESVRGGISLPPKVNLQLAAQQTKNDNVALQLDVYNRGGGIDKINIYHNGKLLSNEGNVVTAQPQQDNTDDHRALMVNITPSAGKNTLKVVVSNDMGIENSGTELSFDGKTKAYTSSLRLLTIGIDKYSDANLNLDYSVADANSVVQAIKTGAKTTVSKHLINENATKPKILAELKELSQGTQQDVLVVYFAGHGLAVGKEWYFLPHETTLQDSPEKIAAAGITATELSDIFKNSRIQHILLMVDSCYSGAGMNAFSQLQNGQRYFTRQLSRSLGITVITATTKDQEATELKNLGHGLFTYLITQDLEKKDATGSATAHGVAENITKTLPVFSKKMLGSSQDPAVYTHGNDFMLTDILKDSSTKKPTQ